MSRAAPGRPHGVDDIEVVVAGSLRVRAGEREEYLRGCDEVVRQARSTAGCLDFALSADRLDDERINVLERWASAQALEAFRGSGPSGEQQQALLGVDVVERRVVPRG